MYNNVKWNMTSRRRFDGGRYLRNHPRVERHGILLISCGEYRPPGNRMRIMQFSVDDDAKVGLIEKNISTIDISRAEILAPDLFPETFSSLYDL